MHNQTTRPLKSVALTDEEAQAFAAWVLRQRTKIDAAQALDITRGTLDRVLNFKSASPETAAKVRSVIGVMAVA